MDTRISKLNGEAIKLHQYPEIPGKVTELKNRLAVVSWSCGVAEQPTQDQLTVIASAVIKHFGELTNEEISYSFELLHAEKLQQQIEHYQKFTTSFVFKVLLLFRKYKHQQLREYEFSEKRKQEQEERERIEKIQKLPEHTYTPEEIAEAERLYCEDAWNHFLSISRKIGKVPNVWPFFPAIFRHLNRVDPPKLSDEQRGAMRSKVKLQIEQDYKTSKLRQSRFGVLTMEEKQTLKAMLEDEKKIKELCARQYVIDYTNKYLKNEKQKNTKEKSTKAKR